jgi:feruloyl esterase
MIASGRTASNVARSAVISVLLSTVLLVLVTLGVSHAASAPDCEALAALALPEVTITKAEKVPAGSYTTQYGQVLTQMPAFCRVAGTAKPTGDSNILFEVWLPLSNWNGRYRAVGNGGYSGNIMTATPTMAYGLRHGYATSSTDRGHQLPSLLDGSFALGHPEKVIDVAYRGNHVTAVAAKAIIKAFYHSGPRFSYFMGCSGGGYEAIQATYRYPKEYDGVLYGAPGISWVAVSASFIWEAQATLNDPASYIPTSKLPMISAAAVAACDGLDGVVDGVLDDPRQCHFDPAVLQCRSGDAPDCLTKPQVDAMKKIYAGIHTSELIYPGIEPSSEFGVGLVIQGPTAWFGDQFFKYFVFDDPNWDFRTMNFTSDIAYANQKWGAVMNALPDLRSFQAYGGKIIGYQGWIDPLVNPQNIIFFTEDVLRNARKHGSKEDFMQLYMVPGMGHCSGGPGPNSFGQFGSSEPADPDRNIMNALERWVEQGVEPDRITATRYVNNDPTQGALRTRPLCPYPQVARWTGFGSTDEAANFVCSGAPDRDHDEHDRDRD